MTLLGLFAVALLVLGVVGVVIPQTPGPLFSLAGVYLYWWSTNFTDPETIVVAGLTLAALLALSDAVVGPLIASQVGDVSTVSATVGTLVGAVLFLFAGTPGFVGGILTTVFVLEYARKRDARKSLAAGVVVVLVSFGSRLMQLVLTGAILAVILAVILL
jgi:uncharacterized protein YqgC (DUF456 family)